MQSARRARQKCNEEPNPTRISRRQKARVKRRCPQQMHENDIMMDAENESENYPATLPTDGDGVATADIKNPDSPAKNIEPVDSMSADGASVATAEPVIGGVPEQALTHRVLDVDDRNAYKTEPDSPVKNAKAAEPTTAQQSSTTINSKKIMWMSIILVIVIIVIVLAVVLTRKEPAEEDPPDPFVYSTGVSLVTSYIVQTKVRSRLARTTITVEVANALDCSSIHSVSLQLPLDTRITSIKTTTTDDCTATGDVQELQQARETFMEQASSGLPGAYVEAQDSFTHSLQVAIPPLGSSTVELVVEQLLKQRLHEVQFEIPLFPNEDIDNIVFDLTVEDTDGEPVDFHVDLMVPGVYDERVNSTSNTPVHLDIPDARQYDIPKVVRGKYSPGKLPDKGLLYSDGTCFEHFFHPSSLDPMPRNFVFVVDVSNSMNGDKIVSAKKALNVFISSLNPEDTFTIQTFGHKGTVNLWGSGPGTEKEKQEANQFLDRTMTSSKYYDGGTNLHEAFLEGLLRAKNSAEVSDDNVATLLIMISDGYASRGETNRVKIAEHVYELNEEGTVKIFPLGFQGSADMILLDAIALMNGGVSTAILKGQDDFDEQIVNFLDREIGTVLMSNVNVKYSAVGEAVNVYGETQTLFPVLADGYEVVVRGLIADSDGDKSLHATTSASTMGGPETWETPATPYNPIRSSLCFQSYAHDRITQLLRLYDASDFLGSDLVKRLVTLSRDCTEEDFAKCIRAEALALAVEANVVAKGLTAMVTVDNEKCMKLDEDAEICLDGTTPDGTPPRDDDYYPVEDYGVAYDEGGASGEPAPSPMTAHTTSDHDAYDDHADNDHYGVIDSASDHAYSERSSAPHRSWISLCLLFFAWLFVAAFDI